MHLINRKTKCEMLHWTVASLNHILEGEELSDSNVGWQNNFI